MERVVSEQTSILDSIGRLESAINGWRSLAESGEWATIAWQLDSPDRDPRQIIAAYDPDNPLGGRYRHDGYTATNLRASFTESDNRRALAVEEALNEHGPVVIRFLQQQDSQEAGRCAEKLMKFLADRRKPDAAILPIVFQVVRQIAVRPEATEELALETQPDATLTLDARALALFFVDRSRTKTDIARLLNLRNVQSLSPQRCPKLDDAMKAWREANAGPPIRGSKDKDGNLEAWDEDE
jgi:hypothetical protein